MQDTYLVRIPIDNMCCGSRNCTPTVISHCPIEKGPVRKQYVHMLRSFYFYTIGKNQHLIFRLNLKYFVIYKRKYIYSKGFLLGKLQTKNKAKLTNLDRLITI